jgi:two-component system chemotaxis response regulator CheY
MAVKMAHKVLVVDDSRIIRTQCRLIFQHAGYEVVEAWDASQAMAVLRTMEIAFMLCDLNIPGMSGLDLVEALREDSQFDALHTAIMTAEASPELLARAKRAGVKAWLAKPCKAEMLLALVATRAASQPG